MSDIPIESSPDAWVAARSRSTRPSASGLSAGVLRAQHSRSGSVGSKNGVILLFDQDQLEIQAIGDVVHLGRTRVMEIVRDVYRRLGKDVPDGRTRRSQLHAEQPSTARPRCESAARQVAGRRIGFF